MKSSSLWNHILLLYGYIMMNLLSSYDMNLMIVLITLKIYSTIK